MKSRERPTEVSNCQNEATVARPRTAQNFHLCDRRPLLVCDQQAEVVLEVGVRVRIAVGEIVSVISVGEFLRS